jgi:hypothetical protein
MAAVLHRALAWIAFGLAAMVILGVTVLAVETPPQKSPAMPTPTWGVNGGRS